MRGRGNESIGRFPPVDCDFAALCGHILLSVPRGNVSTSTTLMWTSRSRVHISNRATSALHCSNEGFATQQPFLRCSSVGINPFLGGLLQTSVTSSLIKWFSSVRCGTFSYLKDEQQTKRRSLERLAFTSQRLCFSINDRKTLLQNSHLNGCNSNPRFTNDHFCKPCRY
jgi:hypothetical protein